MEIADGAAAAPAPPHAVLFPFSTLGHVRPVLQLARRLAYVHGFKVTVVTTSYIYKRLGFAHATSADDNLQHIDLGEGFLESYYYTVDSMVRVLMVALTTLGPLVKELLGSILPITCVISDMSCNELSSQSSVALWHPQRCALLPKCFGIVVQVLWAAARCRRTPAGLSKGRNSEKGDSVQIGDMRAGHVPHDAGGVTQYRKPPKDDN